MQIEVYANYLDANVRKMRGQTVVVIDLLRASTSIITAIENGAQQVIPVDSLESAIAVRRAVGGMALLAGEQNGLRIEGFDLGNSPLEFTPKIVADKSIIMSTTNGSRAVKQVEGCDLILIGALRNRMALCEALWAQRGCCVALVCAGTEGKFSADDIYCAGAMIAYLRDKSVQDSERLDVDDLGLLAEHYYHSAKADRGLLSQSKHYNKLMEMGFVADIEFCLAEDQSDVLPAYRNSAISRLR